LRKVFRSSTSCFVLTPTLFHTGASWRRMTASNDINSADSIVSSDVSTWGLQQTHVSRTQIHANTYVCKHPQEQNPTLAELRVWTHNNATQNYMLAHTLKKLEMNTSMHICTHTWIGRPCYSFEFRLDTHPLSPRWLSARLPHTYTPTRRHMYTYNSIHRFMDTSLHAYIYPHV